MVAIGEATGVSDKVDVGRGDEGTQLGEELLGAHIDEAALARELEADAAGVGLVILPKDRSAPLTPVARRAASGAAEVLPILLATNLARVLQRLKQRGVWLAGTTDQAEQELYAMDLTGPLALVVGSEGQGMRRLTAELCDYRLSIPMAGSVSSLNVSVATAVCLYEIVRQRSRS